MTEPKKVAGIFKFKEDQYEEALTIVDDRGNFLDSYVRYNSLIEKAVNQLTRQGFHPVVVEADIADWRAYCVETNNSLNAKGRTGFANLKVAQMFGVTK